MGMTRSNGLLIGGILVFLGMVTVGTVFEQRHLLPLMGLGVLMMGFGAFASKPGESDDNAR
jgi:hypothetical protein